MEDENLTPAEVLRYKFWKKFNNIAIYISECGGAITISQKGLFFPKSKLFICPAMKCRPAYPIITLVSGVNKKVFNYSFYPHRAVAEVYLRPKNIFEIEVDHLDGNRMNYHVLNLEWVTHKENIRRAVEARRLKKLRLLSLAEQKISFCELRDEEPRDSYRSYDNSDSLRTVPQSGTTMPREKSASSAKSARDRK